MAASYQTIVELAEAATQTATSTPACWLEYLEAAARLYKYPFQEQLLIQIQRPGATACASLDIWNRRLGRRINRGAHGIALVDETSKRPKLKYVFDVADTWGNAPPPYLWTMREEYEAPVSKSLTATYGPVSSDCDDFPFVLHAVAANVVRDSLADYERDFLAARTGSLMEELDEHSAATFFREAVSTSVAWCTMLRCGLEPDGYIDRQEFQHVFACNTFETAVCLGRAVSDSSERILRQIERAVKAEEKLRREKFALTPQIGYDKDKKSSETERSGSYGTARTNLPSGGRLPDPGSGNPGGQRQDVWEVWGAAEEIPPGAPEGELQRDAPALYPDGPPGGRGRGGAGAGGAALQGHGASGGRDGGAKGPGYAGVGRQGEQHQAAGGGNRATEPDLRVTPQAKEAEDAQSPASLRTQEDETPTNQRAEQGFSYQPGDLVWLENWRYEIAHVDTVSVSLHDPDFPLLKRTTTVADFEAQLARDPRNYHLPPRQPETSAPPSPTEQLEAPTAPAPAEQPKIPTPPVPTEQPEAEPAGRKGYPPAHNFRITDDALGVGGPKAKFAANIAAIETLKHIEAEDRPATPEEQETLSRYVGWGGVQEAFDGRKEAWSKEYKQLKALLTPEEYKAARESVLNAHYTSPMVVKAIYQGLERLGFQRGNVLEPACGVGNFFGLSPEAMEGSRLYGVELDPITGRIAQKLYPEAHIEAMGFEAVKWPDNFLDVALGNVPFGNYHVDDPRYEKLGFPIHDYFFAKAIDQVRPGGVIAFITSHFTMDKKDSTVRRYLAQRCELLGAVRLPNNAFLANAGTGVTADILFLQKRERPRVAEPDWVQVGKTPSGLTVGQYFVDHPEMVLGSLTNTSGHRMYGALNSVSCEPIPGADLGVLLAQAIQRLPSNCMITREAELLDGGMEMSQALPADPDMRNFSYTQVDGKLYFQENSLMTLVDASKTGESRIKGLVAIRDVVRRLMDAEMDGCDDNTMQTLQARLNQIYDRFTAQHGLINSRGNSNAFSDDASYPLLCALEVLNDDGTLQRKADMFTKRTIRQWSKITHVDTPVEALGASIGERAWVDLPYMAKLLGRPGEEEAVAHELDGVIFRDPEAGADPLSGWQNGDEYLSGNVKEKLRIALAAEEKEPGRYASNVKALREVQPKDLEASEIGVRLGTVWVPASDIRQFIFELLDTPERYQEDIQVTYSSATDQWYISGKHADLSDGIKVNVTYGTKRINAYEILQSTLNLKDVRIFDVKTNEKGNEQRVLNGPETTLAQQKQTAIKEAFQSWIWQDPERRQRLTRYYNDTFNNTRPRTYDGSHIRFVGMNPEITLGKHQIDAVARIIYGGNTLLGHCVGAGKTWTMAAAVMEMKRLGLCQKAMLAVPSHLTEQVGSEFLRLYPAAKLLVARKKDFETANRKKFCARIATGDYDAIIIGHSQFGMIPVSQELQEAHIETQIKEMMSSIQQMKAERGDSFTIKQMVYAQKRLEEQLKKLKSMRHDDVVTFEELGIDRLFVDEADIFKNLFFPSKMRNVAGINNTDAKKSQDLYMKCRYMDMLTRQAPGKGGRGTIFATGTPISNSMVELFTMMRYLQSDTLERIGLSSFDAWASSFGETVTSIKLKPEGTGYRAKTSFSKYCNLPELMNLWREATDIQTKEMLKLPEPKVNRHTVPCKPTEVQKEMVAELGKRADRVRSGAVDPHEDNMLAITNDGRKLALDQRLIDATLPDDPGNKVNACARNVYRIWQETTPQKGAQAVFCDLSTPKKQLTMSPKDLQLPAASPTETESISVTLDQAAFSVYQDLRNKLVDLGVPLGDIAFIHDYNSDTQKARLFAQVRSGQIRILLGSTQKMGAGTNIQKRLKALHHLDVPWRPRDMEQREGRIIRRGNDYDEVDIYNYITEGTFDAYSYQTLERKQRFISQLMSGKNPARTCEEIDNTALSYAEIKALCAGDPKIKQKMDLDIAVSRLNTLRSGYLSEHYRLEDALLQGFPREVQYYTERIAALEADLGTLEAQPSEFSMTVDAQTYDKAAEAGAALLVYSKTVEAGEAIEAGRYRGFSILMEAHKNLFREGGKELDLIIKGQTAYRIELGGDVRGNITRLDNQLSGIPKELADCRERLQSIKEQIASAKEELQKPWPLEAEWREKSEQLAELNAALHVGGQEPGTVDDTPPEPARRPPVRKALEMAR